MNRTVLAILALGSISLRAAPAHAGVCLGDPDRDGWYSPTPECSWQGCPCTDMSSCQCPAGCLCGNGEPQDPTPDNPNCRTPDQDCDGRSGITCGHDVCTDPPPGQCPLADPVDPTAGTIMKRYVDLRLSFPTFEWTFERSYNSMLHDGRVRTHGDPTVVPAEQERRFGYGWTYTGGEELIPETVSEGGALIRLRFRSADGTSARFSVLGASYPEGAEGVPDPDDETLTPPVGGEYTVRISEDGGEPIIPGSDWVGDLHTLRSNERLSVTRVSDGRQWVFAGKRGGGPGYRLVEIRHGPGTILIANDGRQQDIMVGTLHVARVCVEHDAADGRIVALRVRAPTEACDGASVPRVRYRYNDLRQLFQVIQGTDADAIVINFQYERREFPVQFAESTGASIEFIRRDLLTQVWRGTGAVPPSPDGTVSGDVLESAYSYETTPMGSPPLNRVASVNSANMIIENIRYDQVPAANMRDDTTHGATHVQRAGGVSAEIRFDARHHYTDVSSSALRCGPRRYSERGCNGTTEEPCQGDNRDCTVSTQFFSAVRLPQLGHAGGNDAFPMAYDGRPRLFFDRTLDHRGLLRTVPVNVRDSSHGSNACRPMTDDFYDYRGRPKLIREQDTRNHVEPAGLFDTQRTYLSSARPWFEPESFVAITATVTGFHDPNAVPDMGGRWPKTSQEHQAYGLASTVTTLGQTCSLIGGGRCVPHWLEYITRYTRDVENGTYAPLRIVGPYDENTAEADRPATSLCYHGIADPNCAPGNNEFPYLGRLARSARAAVNGTELKETFAEYDVFGNARVITDANGNITLRAFDTAGRMVATRDPAGAITGYCYQQGSGLLQGIRHPEGNATSFRYDVFGRRTETRHHATTPLATPAACGDLTSGSNLEVCLSALPGWAACESIADDAKVREKSVVTYNREGGIESRRDESGTGAVSIERERRVYTGQLDQVTRSVIGTSERQFAYDPAGDLAEVKDEFGKTFTRYERDAWGHVVLETVTGTAGVLSRTRYGYDWRQNLRVVQTCKNDCLNSVPSSRIPLCALVRNGCEAEPDGAVTTYYEYDDFGRLVTVDSADSGITRYFHDAQGNVFLKQTFRSGDAARPDSAVGYSYDSLGRVILAFDAMDDAYFDGFYEEYHWDAGEPWQTNTVGRVSWVASAASPSDPKIIRRMAYDPAGRVTREEVEYDGRRAQVEYSYDANGNRVSTTYPSGQVVNSDMDDTRLHVKRVTAGLPSAPPKVLASGLVYQPGGGVTALAQGDVTDATPDLLVTTARDERGLPTSILWNGGGMSIRRDLAGNPTVVDEAGQAAAPAWVDAYRVFEYDEQQRLRTADSTRTLRGEVFTYDSAGNRTSRQLSDFSGAAINKGWAYDYGATCEVGDNHSNRITCVRDPSTTGSACVPGTSNHAAPCFPGQPSRTLASAEATAVTVHTDTAATACIQVTATAQSRILVDGREVARVPSCSGDRDDDEGRCRRDTHVAVELSAGDHRVEVTGRGEDEHHDEHGEDRWTPRIRVSVRVEGECAGEDEVDPRQVKRELRKLFKRMRRLVCMVKAVLPQDLAVPDEDELCDDDDADDPVPTPVDVQEALRRVMEQVNVVAQVAHVEPQDVVRALEADAEFRSAVDALLAAQRVPTREELRRLEGIVKRLVLGTEASVALKRTARDPLLRYEYDARGNITAIQPVDTSKNTVDAWGRGVCLAYDAKGRLVRTSITVTEGTPSVPPPPLGEPDDGLVYHTCNGGLWPGDGEDPAYESETVSQSFYDDRNLRIAKRSGFGLTVRYVYDLDGKLLAEMNPLTGLVSKEYVYLNGEPLVMRTYPTGALGDLAGCSQSGAVPLVGVLVVVVLLLARRRRSAWVAVVAAAAGCTGGEPGGINPNAFIPPTDYYYQNDWLGTPQALTNADGGVVWVARYDAFGGVNRVVRNVGGFDGPAVSNNLRFPGQYEDGETTWAELIVGTPFYQNWNRTYDPQDGRYLQSDPLAIESPAGDLPIYAYAYGVPWTLTDESGLDAHGIYWSRKNNRSGSGTPHAAIVVDTWQDTWKEKCCAKSGAVTFDFYPGGPLPGQQGKVDRTPGVGTSSNGPDFTYWVSCTLTCDEDRQVEAVAESIRKSPPRYCYGINDCIDFVKKVLSDAGVISKCKFKSRFPWAD